MQPHAAPEPDTPNAHSDTPAAIGLVAGGGRFPIIVAEALRARGVSVVCAGVLSQPDPELAPICSVYRAFPRARLGPVFRFFRKHGVRHITWAGWIRKELIFQPRRVLSLLPEWRLIRLFLFQLKNKQSQTILGALADAFESEGFELSHSAKHSPEILAEEGVLSARKPTKAQLDDIRFGWSIAKRMADLDVGQSIAVSEKSTIAVESVEGTDENILRAGKLCPRGKFTVIKLAKDDHDMRFDVPTVGPRTMESMRKAKGTVLCIEAGRTQILDREEMLSMAKKYGIVVISLREPPA